VLLPTYADGTVLGSRIPLYVLGVTAAMGTVRSLIHMFAPDGGAGTIAGMDLSQGAANVAFSFALWGSAQLVYAALQWLVLLRYRSLVPLMWLVQLVETLLRVVVGHMKPVVFAHTPPGAIGNQVFVPLSVAMLVVALWTGSRARVDRARVVD
jgi:hypothetical protein